MSNLSRLTLLFVLAVVMGAAAQDAPSPTPEETTTAPATPPTPEPAASPEATAEPTGEDVIPLPEGTTMPEDVTATPPINPDIDEMPDEAFTDPNAIIPDDAPPELDAPGPPQQSVAEITRVQQIRYRDVRVQAEKDPEIAALYEQAQAAKTNEDQRAAMRAYYRSLFAKMVQIDKSLATKCAAMEAAYIRRLAQIRLEPTIPLNPPPTPVPIGN